MRVPSTQGHLESREADCQCGAGREGQVLAAWAVLTQCGWGGAVKSGPRWSEWLMAISARAVDFSDTP